MNFSSHPPSFSLAAVGDIAFNGGYDQIAGTAAASDTLAAMQSLLKADLLIGNLEAILTAPRPAIPPWRYCMRASPDYVQILAACGFRIMSLAANHTMDYGWEAVQETIDRLSANGILTAGAGKDLDAARRPARLTMNGLRVAFLSYCSVRVGVHLYASETQPGVAEARREWIVEDVRKAAAEHDVVIVALHWGDEFVRIPRPEQRQLAREVTDAGARVILGHHPHVLQGMERFGNRIATYSLGNFVFSDEDWKGVDKKGHPFVWPFRLTKDSRHSAIFRADVSAQATSNLKIESAYLEPDLKVKPGGRGAALMKRRSRAFSLGTMYPLYWACRFFPERFAAQYWQNYRHRQLANLRPRHIKSFLRTLRQELQQFRGAKQ